MISREEPLNTVRDVSVQLYLVSRNIQNDNKEIILRVVQESGFLLKFESSDLKCDQE